MDQQERWEADKERADQITIDAAKARKLEREEDALIRAETRRLEREEARNRNAADRVREKDRREQDRWYREVELDEARSNGAASPKQAREDEEARREHELKMIAAQMKLARCTTK